MLQIRELSYNIGERELLKNIHWVINPGKRVALIGPNGAGKTTLLRLITAEIRPAGGSIIKPKNYRIGYLPQEEIAVGEGSILASVMAGQGEIVQLEQQIADIHQMLDDGIGDTRALLQRLGTLEARYDSLGGYTLENQAKAILSGLGFRKVEFQRGLVTLSGGWRMRVYLARLLLQNPDLLLLDEPTNHLDVPSLEWLEQYLLSFSGSMVLVSHDRFFIDRLSQEICELEHGVLTHYAGSYHFYEAQKTLHEEQTLKKWQELRAERERQQRFIERFRYKATKAAQVQSRIKQLEKMQEIELPPPPPQRFHFQIRVPVNSYHHVLHIQNLSFRYGEPWVLQDLDLDLYRGQKVALVGVNGAGKTTLTRLICGELHPQQGLIRIGERTSIGFYAQHQVDALNLKATIMEELSATTSHELQSKIRNVLGLFQFHGEDVFKPIGVLSGGEKARVSLAKILLSPVNFLIMDEPTNHLDLTAKEALEEALTDYDGTLLLIAHDRYFLDKLVTRVLELKNGRLQVYEGNYTDYLDRRAAQESDRTELDRASEITAAGAEFSRKKTKEQKRWEAEMRQSISKERNQLQRQIEEAEKRMTELELQKTDAERQLGDPATYKNGDHAAQLQRDYARIKADMEACVKTWEESQLRLEQLVEQLREIKNKG
ncbi:ATP-binding cassette domain-containing protein [candidate division KSB1 bacterium]|nr:ATP-binding cassette domain-containing protein [candidate division KSB1 bacterium]